MRKDIIHKFKLKIETVEQEEIENFKKEFVDELEYSKWMLIPRTIRV